MNTEDDFILALQLQEEFVNETNQVTSFNHMKSKEKINTVGNVSSKSHNKESSLVDPSWEYIDPTPDVHALFMQFDKRFFWGTLKHVEVRWSPRMTTCAGICCYEGRGGLCSIRLSVPLLKLRPRKDLVETLLHEMIHAYLFVTHNNRDRDGHGPEFHKHMFRINKEAGTKITVYHSFHDEVKLYKQHWWRCDGPCQKRPPYFGMVKRSMNRAPGPNDIWWDDHEKNCGGRYIKVREPDGFSDKKGKQGNKNSSQGSSKMGDIRSFVSVHGSKSTDTMKTKSVIPVKGTKINNVTSLSDMSGSDSNNIKNQATSSHNNIFGMKDLNATNSMNNQNKAPSKKSTTEIGKPNGTISKPPATDRTNKNATFSGKGGKTGGLLANKGSGTLVITAKGNKKEQTVTSKYPSNFVPFSGKGNTLGTSDTKSRTCTRDEVNLVHRPNESEKALKRNTSIIEENATIKKSKNNVIDLTADSKNEHSDNSKSVECPVCGININEADINHHLDSCLGSAAMSEDAVLCSNDMKWETGSCNETTAENELKVNLETSSRSSDVNESGSGEIRCPACNKNILECELSSHLEICLEGVFGNKTGNEDCNGESCSGDEDSEYPCPCCAALQKHSLMNLHLDQCLGGVWDDFTSAS